MKKVKLSGFPLVDYTAKVDVGGDAHVFVKLGTGEALGSDDFVIEVEGVETDELTAQDVLEALRIWTRLVGDVMLAELHRHSEEVRHKLKKSKL
jgi:hypothetical protein